MLDSGLVAEILTNSQSDITTAQRQTSMNLFVAYDHNRLTLRKNLLANALVEFARLTCSFSLQ